MTNECGDGFESCNATIVRSIKQRDLLNTWLRLYAKTGAIPKFDDYQPERISDEIADLVFYRVERTAHHPRIVIDSDGTYISSAYGARGRGRLLDEYLGDELANVVMPLYHECIRRRLPVYSISVAEDMYGRTVDYERLLMPFSDGKRVNRMVASVKAISNEGAFEIRNLMRASTKPQVYTRRAVIAHDLFHNMAAYIADDDVIEFV